MAYYLSASGLRLGGGEEMDDYEQFTWAPGMRSGSHTHYTWVYGTYGVKIARLIHVTIKGVGTATASGGVDSFYMASALPYAAPVTSPPCVVGYGTGGYAYGFFHNTYSNALGAGANIPSHSASTTFNVNAALNYYHI